VIEHTLRAVTSHNEAVCDECEHEFLAWTGCAHIV
jgi:hypothetical protein